MQNFCIGEIAKDGFLRNSSSLLINCCNVEACLSSFGRLANPQNSSFNLIRLLKERLGRGTCKLNIISTYRSDSGQAFSRLARKLLLPRDSVQLVRLKGV